MIKNKHITEGLVYGLTGSISKFSSLLLLPLYTRLLTSDEYGLLELMLTISSALFLVVHVQLSSGVLRFYYESKAQNELGSLLGTMITLFLILNASALFIALILSSQIQARFGLAPDLLIAVVAGLLPNMIVQASLVVLRLEFRATQYLVYSTGQFLIYAILGAVSALFLPNKVIGILWATNISYFLVAIPCLYYIRQLTPIKLTLSGSRRLLFYSAPIMPSVAGSWLQRSASRLFVAMTLGLSAVGVYGVASRLASSFELLSTSFKMTWSPYAMNRITENASEKLFVRDLNLYIFGSFASVVLLSVGAIPLMTFIVPENYYMARLFITILIVSNAISGYSNVLEIGNLWEEQTYKNSAGTIGGAIITVAIIWLFIGRYGIIVAPVATLIGSLAKVILIYWTSQRSRFIPYTNSVSISLLINLLYSFIVYQILAAFLPNVWWATGLTLFTGLVSAYFCWFFTLREEDKQFLIRNFAKLLSPNRPKPGDEQTGA